MIQSESFNVSVEPQRFYSWHETDTVTVVFASEDVSQ